MAKLRFSQRGISLPSHGIKCLSMFGSGDLVFYSVNAPWPEFPINRSFYRIVHVPTERTLCVAITQPAAREVIERFHSLAFDWTQVFEQGAPENQRLYRVLSTLAQDNLIFTGKLD